MSSTKRGGERAASDFYRTPAWAVARLLERRELFGFGGKSTHWLEPSAGDGAIIRAASALRPEVRWTAVELRPECLVDLRGAGVEDVRIGSVLDSAVFPRVPYHFDAAILNPPFSLALPITKIALEVARNVAVLERLNWLESAERHSFFRAQMPDVHVVGRIDFTGAGGDSIPYAWFVWGPPERRARMSGSISLLDMTPLEERKRGLLLPTGAPAGLF